MFLQQENRLIFRFDAEELWLEPWGSNALRVRATKLHTMPTEDWALQKPPASQSEITIGEEVAKIVNGKVIGTVTRRGKLIISNSDGKVLLEEYVRNRIDERDPKTSALFVEAREFKPIMGTGDYHLTLRLESLDRNEKLYGMGQYQQPYLDLKGIDLELAHRNSQASVPFVLSSLGYGMLWNNPGIGRAVLGKNIMSFEAYSTKILDYWFVAGDTPAQICEAYADVTGKVPMMPEFGLGFWQCKLRYQTQEELLSVAREYKKRNLPLDLIVIDFFHWPKQGDWRFDLEYWPDPAAMVKELKEMNVELMVSVWPYVDKTSENWAEMVEKGLLIRVDRGQRSAFDFGGDTVPYDATNPAAREFVWKIAKKNYYDYGIKVFWLDEAEPEFSKYDFDNYRYYQGSDLTVGNIYPVEYVRTFFEGIAQEGHVDIVNLVRCAWAGSQKYGALIWSGDIASSWSALRDQFAAGLNVGIAGIPWWTTDIGGFHGGDPTDEDFHELLVRWFQWGAFCPVMRLHGDRFPQQKPLSTTGGGMCWSGAANEVWSFGDTVYGICQKYLQIREDLRDYTRQLMKEAHEKGSPIIRTCFYVFPADKTCWEVEDQYMYGDKYLVAPIFNPGQRKREVYLPKGTWKLFQTETEFEGEQKVEVDAPLDTIPVFERQSQ